MKKTLIISFCFIILSLLTIMVIKTILPKNHNLLIIVSDALRADVLGCYGGDVNTPNIDWLASRGVLFERAYATSSWTTPSGISMFTGNYPGIYRKGEIISPKGITLPRLIVPEKHFELARVLKEKQKYKVVYDCESFLMKTSNIFKNIRKLKSDYEFTPADTLSGPTTFSDNYKKISRSIRFILNHPADRPFFFTKWIHDPHSEYDPPKEFHKKINVDLTKLEREPTFYSKNQIFTNIKEWNKYEQDYLFELYKKEVESVDERIGFIIEALKRKKFLKKTFIVFTSDHGELFGEQEQWFHGQNYTETLVNVPLVIKGPGIPKGRRATEIVSLVDLTPTLKDLLKIKEKDNNQGKSFAKLLFNKKARHSNMAYFSQLAEQNSAYQDALIEGQEKLLLLKDGTSKIIDLVENPEERDDLSVKKSAIEARLREKVMHIRKNNDERSKEISNIGIPQVDQETIDKLQGLGYLN